MLTREPAAIFAVLTAFLVGGLQALGANGTLAPDVANALTVLVPVVFGLVTRAVVYAPATVARIRAGDEP